MRFAPLLILAATLAFVGRVEAISVDVQVTPRHAAEDNFRIKSSREGDRVKFEVTIENSGNSPDFTAHLVVMDGAREVSSSIVPWKQQGKDVHLEFDVAARYLEGLMFRWVELPTVNGHPMPAEAEHWFYLKDFAGSK